MNAKELRGAAAIVGFGDVYCGPNEAKSPLHLAGLAVRAALQDAGLEKEDIDGVLTGREPSGDERPQWQNILCGYLKMTPRYSTQITIHAAGMNSMIKHAAMAVATGVAEYVLCVGCDSISFLNARVQIAGIDTDPEFEQPYEPVIPAIYAQIARRLMHEQGMTERHLAAVSVACQKWAVHHPYAAKGPKGLVGIEEVLESRMIASPLRLWMCATFGPPGAAGAVIVTTAENARRMSKRPIYILGAGECVTHDYLSDRLGLRKSRLPFGKLPSITSTGCCIASQLAYEMAGLGPSDIDVVQTPSNFAHSALLSLWECGFAGSTADAGELILSGATDHGGRLPANTNGGWISFGQCGIACVMDGVMETVRQLRRETLGLSVGEPEVGLAHALGGMQACHSVTILSTGT
jgi:acetyl-CoA acetyltransferase